jgi:hypothetical protein
VCLPLPQAFKRETADLAQKRLAQSLLSKILSCFVAKLTALAQVRVCVDRWTAFVHMHAH